MLNNLRTNVRLYKNILISATLAVFAIITIGALCFSSYRIAQNSDTLSYLRQEVEDLTIQNTELSNKVDALSEEKQEYQQKYDDLNILYSDLRKDYNEQRSVIDDLNDQLSELQDQYDLLEDENKRLELQLKQTPTPTPAVSAYSGGTSGSGHFYGGASTSGTYSGTTVYWVPGGEVYHYSKSCPSLSRSTDIQSGSIAQSGKPRACKRCG